MKSLIHHTFGPHVTWAYWRQAMALLFMPWRWRNGPETAQLRTALEKQFGGTAMLFGSGREALLALLRSIDLKAGEEVVLQGFTCIVVPNAIHAAGGVPVYADIDPDTLNLTTESIERVITQRTRAVICQHTFGIPANAAALRALCSERNLLLIEDCAHVLPDSKGPSIGRHGDALMLSLGRDKAISGVAGGALIVRKSAILMRAKQEEEVAHPHALWTIARLLSYPDTYMGGRMFYSVLSLGKALLWCCKKTHWLIPVVTTKEKHGHMLTVLHRMPNACAALALWEWNRLQQINDHRRELTAFYRNALEGKGAVFGALRDLPLQKFPLLVPNADSVRQVLKEQNIHLEDGWTGAVVCPRSCDQEAANYKDGACPNAERVAKEILSLPTHPTMTKRQAERLLHLLEHEVRSTNNEARDVP